MTDAPQSQYVSMEDVQKLVDEQLSKVREEHDKALADARSESDARVDAIQAQLDAARAAGVAGPVPWNSGGLGAAVHDTWSYAEQTKAHRAEELAGEEAAAKAA